MWAGLSPIGCAGRIAAAFLPVSFPLQRQLAAGFGRIAEWRQGNKEKHSLQSLGITKKGKGKVARNIASKLRKLGLTFDVPIRTIGAAWK